MCKWFGEDCVLSTNRYTSLTFALADTAFTYFTFHHQSKLKQMQMWKHQPSSIPNKVLNDAVPEMHCVTRIKPPVTSEGLVKDYQPQGKDKGLSFPRVVSPAFRH